MVLGGRHRVEHFARQHLLLDVALHVDDRRAPDTVTDSCSVPTRQLDVDRRGEVRLQLDALAA